MWIFALPVKTVAVAEAVSTPAAAPADAAANRTALLLPVFGLAAVQTDCKRSLLGP